MSMVVKFISYSHDIYIEQFKIRIIHNKYRITYYIMHKSRDPKISSYKNIFLRNQRLNRKYVTKERAFIKQTGVKKGRHTLKGPYY